MEAVPRLPMINFELKTSTEKVTFGPRIKQYIASFYHEDPETYNEEVHSLDSLRGVATRPVIDVSGSQMLKKYYCQLHFLKSRFPMDEGITFSWKDAHSNLAASVADIDFEISCVLYNIGALHSQLGSLDSRSNPDGMKMACTHFQCAVWAFETLRKNYSRMVACFLPPEMMTFMEHICLAQAQECILEKSMLDNRKATIIAKVAVQVVEYYKKSCTVLQNGTEDGSFADILGSKTYKKWLQYINFKIAYHKCVAMLYQGQQAEEQQKMGERVAFYQIAAECLEEARKLSSSLQNKEQIDEALAFTLDVVEGKRKAAKNENEFIYHEDVPDKASLQEVKGASLVKGIPFNVNDSEVSGPDIFARLVPMEAHEASSLYSEHKAQMLRRIGELIDAKDQALAEFLSSLQLEPLAQLKNASGLTQDIVDRAAAMSAQPNAVSELISSMSKLSDMYHDVETSLKEIHELLKEEEDNEKNYQSLMGKRAPSIIATDLSREYQKYMEAHNKASESNQNLHKAMTTHITNLKVLSMPLGEIQQQIPAIELPNAKIDLEAMENLEKLVKKIEEMKTQRATLWNELRNAVHGDDITGVLVTKEANQSLEELFQKELEKHKKYTDLIEQNAVAQENILKAMVNIYADFSESRKYIQDVLNKRKSTMAALITSYDTYEDLLSKAQKGLEFYNKLQTNVTKLLQRIRGASNVQQEERDQILRKNKIKMDNNQPSVSAPVSVPNSTPPPRTPKLKDYLDSRRGGKEADLPQSQLQFPSTYEPTIAAWPTEVRPTPLGSEETMKAPSSRYGADHYAVNDVTKRMAALMGKEYKSDIYAETAPYAQHYSVNQNYNTYSYPATNVNTNSTNSYQTISSVSNPGQYASYGGNYDAGYQAPSAGSSVGTNANSPTTYLQGYGHQGGTYAPQYPYSPADNYANMQEPKNDSRIPAPLTSPAEYPTNQAATYADNYVPNSYNQTPNAYNQTYSGYQPANQNAYNNQPQTYQPAQETSRALPYGSYANYTVDNAANNYQTYDNTYTTAPISVGSYSAPASQMPPYYSYNNTGYYGNQDPYQTDVNAAATAASLYADANAYTATPTPTYTQSQDQYQYQQYYQPEQSQAYMPYYSAQTTYPSTSSASTGVATSVVQPAKADTPKKSSNVDLLAGLDFSVSQLPLTPQVPSAASKAEEKSSVPQRATAPAVVAKATPIKGEDSDNSLVKMVRPKKDPFQSAEMVRLLRAEIDKFEKVVNGIESKTANGQTMLELKWKFVQDSQDGDAQKRIISVARCYPMKNRFADILPYDFSRVELKTTKDDYINATHLKDVTNTSPPFIITQNPLQSTLDDFWSMIWEQQVDCIVCIMSDSEFEDEIYWPKSVGANMTLPNKAVSLQSVVPKENWTERHILISILETRETRLVSHYQFTAWPTSILPVCPGPFVQFTQHIWEQQKTVLVPLLVHCSSGIGRSGLFCLLVILFNELSRFEGTLPDISAVVARMSSLRKNVLRDREHLKFAYAAFLHYLKEFYRRYDKEAVVKKEEPKAEEEEKQDVDPLSMLDPLWASKKDK